MKPPRASEGPHDDDLRRRAEALVGRAIPPELRPHYVPGSIADIVIASCARGESIDAELLELAGISAQEYDGAIRQARTQELKNYYRECQIILSGVTSKPASEATADVGGVATG